MSLSSTTSSATTFDDPASVPAAPPPSRIRSNDRRTRYLLVSFGRKLAQAVVVLFVVTIGVQFLIDLIPGSPAALILGDTASPQAIAAIDKQYGFDKPFFTRYWIWLEHALHGNLGYSNQGNQPVTQVLTSHLPVTLELAILALLISLIIGVPLAVLSAYREGRLVDRGLTGIASVLLSFPHFVSCVILAVIFSARLGWFPVFGWVPISQDLAGNVEHAFLPVVALVGTVTPVFVRVLRADLVAVLREDYILAARARGMSDRYILMRHALRPASLSLFTLTGLIFGTLIGGSIIVENYFALPGIGQVIGRAVADKDLPIVQGVVVVVALVFLVLNTLVDFIYTVIDPQLTERR